MWHLAVDAGCLQDDLDDTEAVIEQTSRRATASSTTVSLGGDAGQAASSQQQQQGQGQGDGGEGLEVSAPTEKVSQMERAKAGVTHGTEIEA